MAIVEGQTAWECCYLAEQTLRYTQPGDQILYYWKEAKLQCKRGWTGKNCDTCAPNFGPVGRCDRCLGSWTGDDCDTCADGWLPPTCDQICEGFGCCNHDNCQGCIQMGLWVGKDSNQLRLEARLTFSGETCSDLVPGCRSISYLC